MLNRICLILLISFYVGCTATPVTITPAASEKLNVRQEDVKRVREKIDQKYLGISNENEEEGTGETTVSYAEAEEAKAMPVTTTPSVAPSDLSKSSSVKEKRLALVIGNSTYQNGGSLTNPINDAESMSRALKKLGFDVITYKNADKKNIKKSIDDFGVRLKGYNVGLFFYAGHGIQVKGINYLIPTDADLKSENDVEYDCVNAERVLAKMEDANTNINIIILDACRDNPFERSWTRSTKGKGLASMNAPVGSLIAYATSPGNTASDGKGSNGVYTSAILEHIHTPNLSVLEMFQKVRDTVINKTNKQQTPWESTSLRGNFYFRYDNR